ncbi:putative hydrolase [Pseudocercospora fuligena]|uniref:Putative hydrolase n=1 Tax=Pseudocercospora fuligena TaxID=685502 RepID=A0A8H6VN60_9PEZI|nr:putative hydrolase [Pseudocercospora fuligena]
MTFLKPSFLLAGLCSIGIVQAVLPQTYITLNSTQPHLDFESIPTSDHLVWSKCADKFDCARLIVPLDWQNVSNPNNISLALIRLPAKVPDSDPNHGGTIITNPGGPGGPGTLWALENAEKLQKQLAGPKNYEILSFDPRGVFSSTPNAYCFENAMQAEIWYDQKAAVGGLGSGDYALKYNWAAEKARGELCANSGNGKYANGDNVRQYVSTAYVARDILEIVNKIDQQRLSVVNSPLGSGEDSQRTLATGTYNSHSAGKLQYFGTSYGTFLGQAFAAMFPQHVGRMVLDANIDADNWVSRYESGIDDHSKIRDYFFETCFAGREKCDFYRAEDHSPGDVRRRFDNLVKSLGEFPQYATGEGRAMPITNAEIQDGFLVATYQPLFYFKPFAKFLNDVLSDVNPGIPFWERPVPTKDTFTDKLLQQKYQGGEVGPAVHCSDGPPLSDEPLSEFKAYLGNLTERFGLESAGLQADYKISCWTWPRSLRTKWRFDGPFEGDAKILFVNNRLDPATSAKNAEKMATRFNGSVYLEQAGAGHGALWPPSECMWKYVKKYVDSGELPEKGTICEPLCRPFEPCQGVDTSKLP